MRETSSRAKRLDNGEWAYGNLVHSIDVDDEYGTIIIPMEESGMFVKGEDSEEHDLGFENWHLVDPNTVCRNTGLTDKDGNEIFEGDILNVTYSDQVGECHHTENYLLDDLRNTSVIGWLDYANELEIVGNRFDNPKLIGD